LDLQTISIAVGIGVGLLTILGKVTGFFGWVVAKIKAPSQKSPVLYEIPPKTIILVPVSSPNAFWWHMGSSGDQPAMQIVGDLTVTNICKYKVLLTAAKMRKPKAMGHVMVRDVNSNYYGSYMIPEGGVSDLRFDFWVMPPVRNKGETFKADIAIMDQFGNEHWLKNIEFLYS
jgi:hypothetical protein